MKKAITGGLLAIAVILMTTGVIPSCTHETLNLDQMDTVCFKRDIQPIFINGCATTGCHDGKGEGRALKTYDDIVRRVTPGSPSQSEVYQMITATLVQPMPPTNALAEVDRIRIRMWIEQGAKNDSCSAKASINYNYTGDIK